MRSLFYLLTALAVIGLATWAYRENHLTQQAMNTQARLERKISRLEAEIAVQQVEWAYLNRPDRLRALVDVNFETLRLVPITAEHFGEIGDIAYPVPQSRLEIGAGVEVFGPLQTLSGTLAPEQEDQP
jgi:hypothetical protein